MAVAPQNFNGTETLNTSKYSVYLRAIESNVTGGATNQSTVACELHIVRSSWGWISGAGYNGSIVIDGTSYPFSYSPNWASGSSGDVIVGSASKVVTHNSDGRKTCAVSGTWNTSGTYSCGTASASGNYVLTNIPRYANITLYNLTDKGLNSIDVEVSVDATCDLIQYSANGGAWTTIPSGDFGGIAFGIDGLTPNTTYSVKVRVRRKDSQLYTESSAKSITTYDIARFTSLSNLNIGDNIPVSISNPSGAEVDLWIRNTSDTVYALNEYALVVGSNTITTDSTINNAFYSMTPNSNTLIVRYVMRTRKNGVDYWVTEDKEMYVVNSNPTFNNFTYKDINATTVALTGNDQVSIGKYSTIEVKIPSANKMVAKNYATPIKYTTVIGEKSKDITYNTGDVTGSILNANSNVINVFAIDSRNNQTQVTKSITLINYSEPLLQNIRFERKDGVGTTVLVTGGGQYNPVNFGAVANTITNIQYRRKLKSSETWEDEEWVSITGLFTIAGGTIANKTSNEIIGTTWDLGVEYDVQIRATDKLSTHTLNNITVNSGNVLMDAVKNKGVSFGGLYNELKGTPLQVNGEPVVAGGGGGVSGDTLPIGAIMPYSSNSIPENWLLCDGQAISRIDYSELFGAFGTRYGEGDGSTTFNIPNIKGRVIVHKDTEDNDFNVLGEVGGHKLLQSHTHTQNAHRHSVANSNAGGGTVNGTATYGGVTGFHNNILTDNQTPIIQNTGGGNSENLQPYIVQNYIIKAKQSAGVVATVVDSLTSTSTTDALSAKQGKILNEKIVPFPKHRGVGQHTDATQKWCRFGRITIPTLWRTAFAKLSVIGNINGQHCGEIYIKMYYAENGSYTTNCYVNGKGDLTAARLKGIVVSATNNNVIVDYYIQTTGNYRGMNMVLEYASNNFDFSISEDQRTALPSGTQLSFS